MAVLTESLGAAIAMAADGTLQFFPTSITAWDISVGEINLTTLANTLYQTKTPTSLRVVGDMTIEALYDVSVWSDMLTNVGVNTLFTLTMPANAGAHTLAIYAFIKDMKPGAFVAGEAPKLTLTITPTMRHSSTGAETNPSYS